MTIESLIASARDQGASDLHLEPGLPPAFRVRGSLRTSGDPLPGRLLMDFARQLLGNEHWPQFVERRSADLSQTIQGVRCRLNVFQTARGIAFAIRLLASFEATLEALNLHPDIKRFAGHTHGLILVSGPTGSGKSSTLAALVQEINLSEARHVLTIESPIEFAFRPRRAYIRQREVGRDTPSFEQALLDALREDPDVLMVGEMRDPETMRLTLAAAETGHLVLSTVHSSNCTEALQRIVGAFPGEVQNNVAAELADCLVAVIAQRLQFRPDLGIRIPECEVLVPTIPVRNFIRNRDFFKMQAALETGAEHGMWTFARYRSWLEKRTNFYIPDQASAPAEPPDELPRPLVPPPLPTSGRPASERQPMSAPATPPGPQKTGGPIEIEPVEEFGKILKPPKP